MAVNHGCSDCQETHGQATGGNIYEDGNILQRRRTASLENDRASPAIFNPYYTGRPRSPGSGSKSSSIDRQEIIRKIKSGESRPTSPVSERVVGAERVDILRESIVTESRTLSPEPEPPSSSEYGRRKRKTSDSRSATPNTSDLRPKSPNLNQIDDLVGLQIQRPRSALHRGDFREREQVNVISNGVRVSPAEMCIPPLSSSPVAPWHPDFALSGLGHSSRAQHPAFIQNDAPGPVPSIRHRGASNASLSSTFIYHAPTSPLVQSSRPDTPEQTLRERSRSPDKLRRQTFSPQSFSRTYSALNNSISTHAPSRPALPLLSERTYPYQAHQPRRSLNSASFFSCPQTPVSRPDRRPSLSGDSLLHYAPMVGSYEESILRGRMSTVPSRPLNFMAQIGVLGKGDCKPSLRCPPHVSVAFPAVFYSYGSGNKNPANDQPSPYVGLIDLENNLNMQNDIETKRRQKLQDTRISSDNHINSLRDGKADEGPSDSHVRRRRRQKAKRRPSSPKAPLGGSYRIPQEGQLQIVIKNPNKTAVKLFLVPYDLSDMEPGQKTFIRQRSYSAGPVIDMPLSSRKNLGTDRPEAALNASDDPNDRPMLRYLIHMHICCPAKGRFFLYKSIRVVFANRVPDGKEKLKNEIQLPEPRYSIYKASRDSNLHVSGQTTAKDDGRRRSAIEQHDFIGPVWPIDATLTHSLPAHQYSLQQSLPTPPFPRQFTVLPLFDSRPSSGHMSDGAEGSMSLSTSSIQSPVMSDEDQQQVVPRLQDPLNFHRERSRERKNRGQNESLLSKRLMDSAVRKHGKGDRL